jgi:hypothetical protein
MGPMGTGFSTLGKVVVHSGTIVVDSSGLYQTRGQHTPVVDENESFG